MPKVRILVQWINFINTGRISREGSFLSPGAPFYHYRLVIFGNASDGAQRVIWSYQIGSQQALGFCVAWLLTNKMGSPPKWWTVIFKEFKQKIKSRKVVWLLNRRGYQETTFEISHSPRFCCQVVRLYNFPSF